jgi:hypothetical protein
LIETQDIHTAVMARESEWRPTKAINHGQDGKRGLQRREKFPRRRQLVNAIVEQGVGLRPRQAAVKRVKFFADAGCVDWRSHSNSHKSKQNLSPTEFEIPQT